jgi:dephospho-CoA kinase
MKTINKKFIKLEPRLRLYNSDKPIIALTGGVASGKSTVKKIIEQHGLKVIDADQLVKGIYQEQGTKDFIKMSFPDAWINNEINFPKLREIVFTNQKNKEVIESFIYAHLSESFRAATHQILDQDFYIYDVPLLFERHLETNVDVKLVVYAPRPVQIARLLKRDNCKEEIGNKILDSQMSIEEKKEKADFVVDNSGAQSSLTEQVDQILLRILN